VVVKASRNDDNVQKTQMGVIDVPMKLANSLPVVLGERDIMKIIQLLPGVQAGNEGTTGFYVRRGNSDQNLVQLDEATVNNPIKRIRKEPLVFGQLSQSLWLLEICRLCSTRFRIDFL